MSAVAKWFGRKALLYVLLVVAIAFFTLVWPSIKSGSLDSEIMSPEAVRAELQAARSTTQHRVENDVERVRRAEKAELAQRLSAANVQLDEARRQRREYGGVLDSIRPSKILQQRQLDLRISALNVEIAALKSLQNECEAGRAFELARREALRLSRVPTETAVRGAQAECRRATQQVKAFEKRWPPDRIFRQLIRNEREKLQREQRQKCGNAKILTDRREAGLKAQQAARTARARYDAARHWIVGQVDDVSREIPRTVISNILKWAAVVLAVILALPLLIRLLFFFVLAPVAERRPAIVLPVDPKGDTPIASPGTSKTSVSVELRDGEELLVRQGFLQSTSETGSKQTRWLLDWHHPLSSVASGMIFLTRISGKAARTTVSAVHDPFAEVTMVELRRGSSCVILPRALAAVVQPIAEPIKITRHWQIASLHAWLTLQLRYLVFHGPARLIVKGSRGVRVEPARRGRIFGQQQLIGFSSDLAYSVRRTETFWPYFLGREQLLKDRIQDGAGVIIFEEAPMAGQRARGVKKGLEGAFDAVLKAFGL